MSRKLNAKLAITSLFLIFILSVSQSSAGFYVNIIKNHDFEDGYDYWDINDAERILDDCYSGYCMELEDYESITQDITNIDVVDVQWFHFNLREKGFLNAKIEVTVYYTDHNPPFSPSKDSFTIKPKHSWNTHSISIGDLDQGKTIDKIKFKCFSNSGLAVLLDNVELTQYFY